MGLIRSLFGLRNAAQHGSSYAVPAGQRVYAIGDIHGRLDLFERLIAMIEQDDLTRGEAETTVILLGDLVDRGPDSAAVIDAARAWGERRRVRHLQGNHEEMFLDALTDKAALRHFLRIGGKETILSYPPIARHYRDATLDELLALLDAHVPDDHVRYLRAMENFIRIGGYVFAHAGVMPGVAMDEQRAGDLRWIREPFLSDNEPRDFCVVHGHTIREEVEIRANRIGLDTGAYRSGRLTAIGLQGDERWFMEASLARQAA